jgi:hypothetical protein
LLLFFANINAETMLQVSTSIMNRDDAAFPFLGAAQRLNSRSKSDRLL